MPESEISKTITSLVKSVDKMVADLVKDIRTVKKTLEDIEKLRKKPEDKDDS